MKITFSPAGTQDVYVIEGELTELQQMIENIIGTKPSIKPATDNKPVKVERLNTEDTTKIIRFLDSVYLYPADNKTFTGKGRFIANILADMKPHPYSELERKSNAVTKTVDSNIAKLRSAGAVIEVASNTVRLVSFPDKKSYVKKRRSASKNVTSPKATKTAITTPTLVGLKLS